MRVYEASMLTNGVMTGNLESTVWQLHQMFGAAAECVVTGNDTAAGVLTILGSASGNNFAPLEINGSPVTLTVAGNGTYIFDVTTTQLQYLQITYGWVSGSGTLNIDVYSKGF